MEALDFRLNTDKRESSLPPAPGFPPGSQPPERNTKTATGASCLTSSGTSMLASRVFASGPWELPGSCGMVFCSLWESQKRSPWPALGGSGRKLVWKHQGQWSRQLRSFGQNCSKTTGKTAAPFGWCVPATPEFLPGTFLPFLLIKPLTFGLSEGKAGTGVASSPFCPT